MLNSVYVEFCVWILFFNVNTNNYNIYIYIYIYIIYYVLFCEHDSHGQCTTLNTTLCHYSRYGTAEVSKKNCVYKQIF